MLLVIVNFVLNCLDNTSWWDILLVLYISSMFIYLLAFVELPSLASLYCYWYWVVCFACADCLLILCYWVVRTCIIELFLVLVLVSWPFAGHYFALFCYSVDFWVLDVTLHNSYSEELETSKLLSSCSGLHSIYARSYWFFSTKLTQCLYYLTDFLLLGVLWVVHLMIFLWFYWELCILFLDPFLYGFFLFQ